MKAKELPFLKFTRNEKVMHKKGIDEKMTDCMYFLPDKFENSLSSPHA